MRILFIALPCLLSSPLMYAQASNNAGVLGLTNPIGFCAGTHSVKVNIANNGNNELDSVRIHWSIDGSLQTPVHYKNPIDTFGSVSGNISNVTLGPVSFITGVKKLIKIWTSHPNGVADITNSDDTLQVSLRTALSGNYTIGGSGADYSSLTIAAADLNTYGVCGAVKFNISAGTYKERLVLTKINGASATNTVTFDGGNKINTTIEYNGASVNDWQTLLLNGANYVTIKNLTIKAIDSTYAIGIHLVNASNNTIDSCDIGLSKNSNAPDLFGIAGSGSTTDATSAGASGDYNTFSNLSISGGYYGIRYTGTSTTQLSMGNKFLRNTVKDFTEYGCYLYALSYTTVEGNKVFSKSNTSGSGIYLNALASFVCTKNYIYTGDIGLYIQYANYYQFYKKSSSLIANNIVSTAGSTSPFLNFKYSRHIDLFHNSFLSNSTYGVYMENVDSTNIRNNIFTNMGKNGTVFYSTGSTFSSIYKLDNNIYYAPNCKVPVYWDPSTYNSLGFWFTWGGNNMNSNSFEVDPQYVSNTDLHLKNGNNPKGPDIGIIDDIDGKIRCPYSPTIGASEIAKGSQADSTKPVNICVGDTLRYTLSPPNGLTNSDYGTKWSIDSLVFETPSGTHAQNFSITYPSSSGDGSIAFYPSSADADSSYFLSLIYLDLVKQDCDSTFGTFISVYPRPKAEFSVNKTQVCLGDSFTFSNGSTASPSIKFLWYMGNGEVLSRTSFTYIYKQGGIYNVKLVAYTPACTDTFTKTLIVGSFKVSDLAKGTPYNGFIQKGTLTDPDDLCVGDTVTYEILAPFGFSNLHYDTFWRISKVLLTSLNGGTPLSDTMTMAPDSFDNFKVRFIANRNLSGDTVALQVTLSSMAANNCDTTLTRHLSVGYAPIAAFGFTPVCYGEGAVVFHDSSSIASGLIAKTWDLGDGTTTGSKFVSHTYADPGKYTVKLTVISAQGCTDVATRSVEIYEPPKINFSVVTQCAGSSSVFFDSTITAGTITSRLWKFGDGSTDTTINPLHTYKNAGSYQVTLIAGASTGCIDSVTKTITVLETPIADFNFVPTCRDQPLKFTNLSKAPAGTTLSYKWDFGKGFAADSANPSHVFAGEGPHQVKLVTISSNGCSDTIVKSVSLLQHPNVSFGPSSTNICRREQITFIDSTDSKGAAYYWNFGDGNTSTDTIGKHIYDSTGTFTVMLRITSAEGCADSAFRIIQVFEAPLAEFNADTTCMGSATIFKNISMAEQGAVYHWDFGDGKSSADEEPSHIFTNAGPQTVKLTVTNVDGGCSDTHIANVVVHPLPDASFTVDHFSPSQRRFIPTDTSSSSYLWYFGDGDSSSSVSPVHAYQGSKGNYPVKLIVTSQDGCRAEHTELIQIDVGINEENAGAYNLNVYPNPFTGSTLLKFNIEKPGNVRILLTDILGHQLALLEHNKKEKGFYSYEINAAKYGMAEGIYYLRIIINDKQSTSKLILH